MDKTKKMEYVFYSTVTAAIVATVVAVAVVAIAVVARKLPTTG
jgi:hypothetical protein